jgi:hypothetical protein
MHQALNCPNVQKEYTSPLTADVGDNGMKMASVVDTVLGFTNLITALTDHDTRSKLRHEMRT